jgi:internalin A
MTQSEQLKVLPGTLGRLVQLQVLDVADNALAALPSQLGRLVGMRELDAAANRVRWLPLALRCLTGLRRLGLSGNPLVDPPPDVLAGGAAGVVRFLEAGATKDRIRRDRLGVLQTRRDSGWHSGLLWV